MVRINPAENPLNWFVQEGSVVRKIWGRSETILFIFAGASAEFAVNKAVDWLYFTGKLPADPLGRLFSTVAYARKIVFSTREVSHQAIDAMRQIHQSVEKSRGYNIPDWAYRDVLYMLIHYSIVSFELLERKLTLAEKEEVYQVFYSMGMRMGLKELPLNYEAWIPFRDSHLKADLKQSNYSNDLFDQYRLHLGGFRFRVLIEAQKLVIPSHVSRLLNFSKTKWLSPFVPFYKLSRMIKSDALIKLILLPDKYKNQINELDVN